MIPYRDANGTLHEVQSLTAIWNPFLSRFGIVRVHAANCCGCGFGAARAIMDQVYCDMVNRINRYEGTQWR